MYAKGLDGISTLAHLAATPAGEVGWTGRGAADLWQFPTLMVLRLGWS